MVSRGDRWSQARVIFLSKALNVFDSRTVFRSNCADFKFIMKKPSNSCFRMFTVALGLTSVLALTSAIAADHDHGSAKVDASKLPPAATKTGVTFAADIKPIFDVACVKCHGDEKPKAGLKLTSLEATLKGTKDGKVVVPGDAVKSSLLISVACIGEEDHWMPPKNNKAKIAPLTKEQVGLVRAWIEQGAK